MTNKKVIILPEYESDFKISKMKLFWYKVRNYFYVMLFGIGILIMPNLSHATTYLDNSQIGKSSWITATSTQMHEVSLGTTTVTIPSGTTITVGWLSSTTQSYFNGNPNYIDYWSSNPTVIANIIAGDQLANYTTGNGLTWTTSTVTTSATIPAGSYITIAISNGNGGSNWQYGGGVGIGATTTVNTDYGQRYYDQFTLCAFVATNDALAINTCGGGGGGSNPSISFILPNASGTSPDFQNWLLNVSTTASSTYGNVKVWYGQSSSSYDFSDQAQFSAFVNINPFLLSKSQLLNPIVSFNATSTWYAMAEYYGDGFDVTSTQIQFHINPQALTPNTSSSASVGYFSPIPFTNPSSTGSSSLPYADCGITAIGGCLTNAGLFLGNFFFQPNPQVVNSMNANFNHIKGSFPFSAFFNVIDTAKANATTTSGNYDLYLNITSKGIHIPILTSTTLEMAIGSSSKAMVFTTEKNIIWLGTGVAMLSLLLL